MGSGRRRQRPDRLRLARRRHANVTASGDKSDKALADRIASRLGETVTKSQDGGMRYSRAQQASAAAKVLGHSHQKNG